MERKTKKQKCELCLKDCKQNHEPDYDCLRKHATDAYLTYRKKYRMYWTDKQTAFREIARTFLVSEKLFPPIIKPLAYIEIHFSPD